MCCKLISCKKCLKKTPTKRYFLPLIGIVALLAFEEIHDLIYYPIIIAFIAMMYSIFL